MRLATEVVQFEAAPGDALHPSSTPIYQTATFEQESPTEFGDYDYSRSGNPTRTVVEAQLARLDRAHAAFVHSSGMASLATVATLAKAGDEVILGDDLYGGTYRYFTRIVEAQGVEVLHVDTTDLDAVADSLCPRTRLLLVESPTNPALRINDLRALAELSHSSGTLLVVDNTLMSPALCRPLELGADLVVHSATKALSGHSDLMAGAVCVADPRTAEAVAFATNAMGNALGPFESWLLLRGTKTLALRVERQNRSAEELAARLASVPGLGVLHPSLPGFSGRALHFSQAAGGGNVVCLSTGDPAHSAELVARTRLFRTQVSFGGLTSSISLPYHMSHASIPESVRAERAFGPDLVRLSVGIEDVDDLWDDLAQAMERWTGSRQPAAEEGLVQR